MSTAMLLIPGIMGSELVRPNGEIVWPPKVSEVVLGYRRIDALQDPAARATRIIARVSCVQVYAPLQALLAELGFGETGENRLLEHPYDWRRDLFDLAGELAARLDTTAADDLVIVAHSMGGLIARLLLETAEWRHRPWFGKIRSFIALATPHNGAPLALARIVGLDSAMGISAENFRILASNPAFPSGYQLLPAPGEDACWNTDPGADLAPLDYYDPDVARRLGMDPGLVARAKALHDALRGGSPPAHVRYFFVSGAGHKTVTRVNAGPSGMIAVATPDAGDGTVPMWSALPRAVQKHVVVNDHSNVFRGEAFRNVFFRLFGQNAGDPNELFPEGAPPIELSLQKPVFGQGAPVELVLSSEQPFSVLQAHLVFRSLNEKDETIAELPGSPIRYEGPLVNRLALSVESGLPAGLYEMRLDGSHQLAERMVFAVTQAAD